MAEYSPPVDRLLTLGYPDDLSEDWHEYRDIGFTREHVPDLLRMAGDRELRNAEAEDSPQLWAPIHAWRVLGVMGAAEGVGPLLDYAQANEEEPPDDWITEEMPAIFVRMGPPALPPLLAALEDTGRTTLPRVVALEGVEKLVDEHPELREQVVSSLVRVLEHAEENSPDVNGFVIATLAAWKVTDAMPLIERVYQAGMADRMCAGSWEYVLYHMGLGPHPEEARENAFGPPPVFNPDLAPDRAPSGPHTPRERAKERSKTRRKGKKKRKK